MTRADKRYEKRQSKESEGKIYKMVYDAELLEQVREDDNRRHKDS